MSWCRSKTFTATSVTQSPGNRMRRSGCVGAIQGSILAPLTLVDHPLPAPTGWTILGLSVGKLSCGRKILFFSDTSLLWSSLPAATVRRRTLFRLSNSSSLGFSFTSTSSVALQHLGILQTIQPWSLGIPRGNICEKRDCCNSPADNRVAIGRVFFFKSNSNVKKYKENPAFECDLIVSSVASPFESPPPFCPFCNWNK